MVQERYVYNKVFINYGKIVLTIDKVLKQKNMNAYKLSRLTGISWNIVKKYINGNIYRVDLDLLSRMCFVLQCSLEDLIHYEFISDDSQNKEL